MKKIIGYVLSIFMLLLFAHFTIKGTYTANNTVNSKTQKVQNKNKKSTQGYFYAKLSGENVVPPVKTKASGEAMFEFSKDGKKITYSVKLKNINAVTMAHIHHAAKGKNGSIAVWLYKGKPMSIVNGFLSHGTITDKDVNLDSLKTWMKNGDAYVLVHTKDHPNGEIRGQIHFTTK